LGAKARRGRVFLVGLQAIFLKKADIVSMLLLQNDIIFSIIAFFSS